MKIVFSQSLEIHSTLIYFFTELDFFHFSWRYLNFSEIISNCQEIRVYFLYKMTMPEIGSRKSAFISLGKSLLIFRNRQNMGENLTQLHRLSWILDEIDSGFLLRLRTCKLSINLAETWCRCRFVRCCALWRQRKSLTPNYCKAFSYIYEDLFAEIFLTNNIS